MTLAAIWHCTECGSAPRVTYVICTNPRTGSWLLADGLTATGLAGKPREWLNPMEVKLHRDPPHMLFSDYLKIACTLSHTPNGVSGVKLHYFHLMCLAESLHVTPAVVMRRIFPGARYIYLTRHDKVRQAVSFLLAKATDEWRSDEPGKPGPEPEFSAAAITDGVERLSRWDDCWWKVFEDNCTAPLELVYEYDLEKPEYYQRTVRSALRWLGVAKNTEIPPPLLRKQAGELAEEWVRRYYREA